ncbi:MAG: Fic/DOC family protein [Syntrophus sp. PtaU1.Bin208]|nr:MAG: Fic/DOC family protein [Syntrophus sp. PtaU1.Bin208]
MKTLQRFSGSFEAIPSATSWHIADLAEACGRQASYKRQSSARLLTLQKHALVESAVSSNRIDALKSEAKRAGGTLFERRTLWRSDEAVLGYRKALELISGHEAERPFSVDALLQLHVCLCGETSDNGIPEGIEELIALWSHSLAERWVHPLLLLTAFNLDFLCLRPFSDGNGRMSRLLLLLQSCHLGYDVGRYISLERLIEQNRNQYREALEESSQGWQDGNHNPWPYIDYLLFIFKTAYGELESRLNAARSVRGAKTRQIETAVRAFPGPFSLSELEKACPGTSHDMVRKVLRDLRNTGSVECLDRGPGARWQRKENILSPKIDKEAHGEENLRERSSG